MTEKEAHIKIVRLAGQAGDPAGRVIVSRQQYEHMSKAAVSGTVFTKVRLGVQHAALRPLWDATALLCDCLMEAERC